MMTSLARLSYEIIEDAARDAHDTASTLEESVSVFRDALRDAEAINGGVRQRLQDLPGLDSEAGTTLSQLLTINTLKLGEDLILWRSDDLLAKNIAFVARENGHYGGVFAPEPKYNDIISLVKGNPKGNLSEAEAYTKMNGSCVVLSQSVLVSARHNFFEDGDSGGGNIEIAIGVGSSVLDGPQWHFGAWNLIGHKSQDLCLLIAIDDVDLPTPKPVAGTEALIKQLETFYSLGFGMYGFDSFPGRRNKLIYEDVTEDEGLLFGQSGDFAACANDSGGGFFGSWENATEQVDILVGIVARSGNPVSRCEGGTFMIPLYRHKKWIKERIDEASGDQPTWIEAS